MKTAQGGLSHALADLLLEVSFDELPAAAVNAAKDRILDALSVSLNGKDLPVCKVAVSSVRGGSGPCTVIGESISVSASDAAFANAVIGHSTLQEDVGGGAHPSTFVIPAALAAGEERQRSGRDLLAAIVAGYEAAARVARATPPAMWEQGFRTLAMIGAFGAAATAGKLYGLDAKALASALDIAANTASGLYQAFWDGSMEAYFHAGFAARNGLFAARLAQEGAATSTITFDGPHGFFRTFGRASGNPDALIDKQRGGMAILQAYSKRFPACLVNQRTLALTSAMTAKDLSAEDVAKIVVRRPIRGVNGIDLPAVASDPPYANMLQAQMSAKFTTVAGLLGRPVGDLAYYRDFFGDAEVAQLARRTELVGEERTDVTIEVFFCDGRKLELNSAEMPNPYATAESMADKFRRLGARVLGSRVQEVLDVVAELDGSADVADLTRLLRL